MGRFHSRDEQGVHEGYVVGYVPRDWMPTAAATAIGSTRPVAVLGHYSPRSPLRELGALEADRQHDVHGIAVVGYACTCGWRSRYREEQASVEWSPNIVHWSESLEGELAQECWAPHVEAELRRAERFSRGQSTGDRVHVALDLPRQVAVDLLAFLNSLGNSDLNGIMKHLGDERTESANVGLSELGDELALLLWKRDS